MNAAERFNMTTDSIEKLALTGQASASEIGFLVAKSNGISWRDLSVVFNYLADMTLNSYIVERKLAAAYRFLVTSSEKGKSSAVEIAGYSDQPTFTKAFKRMFGMTPGEAQKRQDLSLISSPLTWDQLSTCRTSETSLAEVAENMEEKVFGVSESSFEKIVKALELEAFYGFSKMFSKYAFDLSEHSGHTLNECFKYANSLRDFGGDFEKGFDDELTPVERLHEYGDNESYQMLFFTRGISVDMSWTLINLHFVKPEVLLSCDPDMLMYFPGFEEGVEVSFDYFTRAYNFYASHFNISDTEDAFNEYLDLVLYGHPIEEALSMIYGSAVFEQDLNQGIFPAEDDLALDTEYEEIERYSSIENEAYEEARWHGKRIDDDLYYDSENDYYDQYDREDADEW